MAVQSGTRVLPPRRAGISAHLASGATDVRPVLPARRSGAATLERRTVLGDVVLTCLAVASGAPRQLPTGEGTVQVAAVLSGSALVRGGRGQPIAVERGGVAAVVGALTLHDGGPATILLITLPLQVLSRRGIRLPRGLVETCTGSALRGPLREFAYALHRSPPAASAPAARAAERSLVELLVGTLLESEPPSVDSATLRGILRSRAMAVVQHRFTDPSLRPRLVALELNVSLRHLQRSFEGSGTTIALEIRRARSEYAATLIETLTGPDRTDRRIAARAGFSSAGQLRAAFDDHFGIPTSSYRLLGPSHVLLPSA